MPADYTRFANGDEVENILTLAGFWPEEPERIAAAKEQAAWSAAAAERRVKERCGWSPFLRETDTRDYFVDGAKFLRTAILPLESGLLSLTSVAFNGVNYDLNLAGNIPGCIRLPMLAEYKNRPWQALRFPLLRGAIRPASVVRVTVTGDFGFADTVPEDLWMVSLAWACVETFTKLDIEQDTASLSDPAGFTKAWDIVGTVTPKDLLNEWPKREKEVIEQYERKPLPGVS